MAIICNCISLNNLDFSPGTYFLLVFAPAFSKGLSQVLDRGFDRHRRIVMTALTTLSYLIRFKIAKEINSFN